MRKIFKKVITAVASMAMLAGMVAGVPTIEAKAATATTEVILVLSDSVAGNVLLDINDGATSQNAGITCTTGTVDTSVGWGRDMYRFTKVSDTEYKITVEGDVDTTAGEYCNMQFIFTNATGGFEKGYKYYIQNDADTFNNNSKVYISIDLTRDNWSDFSASATDPNAITAAQVIAKIDEIGTVEYTDASKAKLQAAQDLKDAYQGADSTITNLNKLTEGWAKYNELKTAAETGTITVYVKVADTGWSNAVKIYGWGGASFGAWPGIDTSACTKNTGWYNAKFNVTDKVGLVINAGSNQTVDINNVSKGTYWITVLADKDETKNKVDVKTTAPANWKDENASEIATVPQTTVATVTTQAATTADSSFVAKDIKVKVKLDAAITWDKVYVYAWNADGNEGAWPGTEATKEGDYYVITINAKTKYVNMIANNGSGEQTIDIENIDCSGDEVILNVSGEKNSDGKYVGTSPSQKTTTSGDTTPFVAIVAVLAMLGCAFVALNSKKARR